MSDSEKKKAAYERPIRLHPDLIKLVDGIQGIIEPWVKPDEYTVKIVTDPNNHNLCDFEFDPPLTDPQGRMFVKEGDLVTFTNAMNNLGPSEVEVDFKKASNSGPDLPCSDVFGVLKMTLEIGYSVTLDVVFENTTGADVGFTFTVDVGTGGRSKPIIVKPPVV